MQRHVAARAPAAKGDWALSDEEDTLQSRALAGLRARETLRGPSALICDPYARCLAGKDVRHRLRDEWLQHGDNG